MRKHFPALLVILSLMPTARADVLHVAGAGSLASAFTDLLRRFPAGPDAVAMPEFGPSGLMREKIEAGANVDLFASADMAQARRLAVGHPERFVVNFTRNRLCAIARGALGLTRRTCWIAFSIQRYGSPLLRPAQIRPATMLGLCSRAPSPCAPARVRPSKPKPSSCTAAERRLHLSFPARAPLRESF